MSMTVASLITAFFPMVIGADLDEPGVCSIAVDEGVFTDHRAIADSEQIGADGHVCREDHNAASDLRAQRPQIKVEQRRTGEQHNRVPPHQRLDNPKPDIRQAPDADLLWFPSTDQDPLRQDRNSEQEQEHCAAGKHRPEIDVEHTRARRNPLIALSDDQRSQIGISQEDQQLQRPTEHDLQCSRPFRPPRPRAQPATPQQQARYPPVR